MDLDDLISARQERDFEDQEELRLRLEGLSCRLAALIASADRALNHAGVADADLAAAFRAVRGQLAGLLEAEGVELIGAPGEVIDSARYEVAEVRGDPVPGPPRVVEVLAYGAGSKRDGRLLARARVVATVSASATEG